MTEYALPVIAAFVRSHAGEAAHVLEGRPLDELVALLASVSDDLAATLLARMEVNTAARGLERIEPDRAAVVLAGVPATRALALARGMDEEARSQVLRSLPPKRREQLEHLLSLRQDAVGTRMNSRVVTLTPETTAAEAIVQVRADPAHVSQYLYVVDRLRRLLGVVSLKQLLAGIDEVRVDTLMTAKVISVRMRDSLSSVQVHPAWVRYRMLPVVDEHDRFAGVLRHLTVATEGADASLKASPADEASAALGDLYRIGLTAMFNSAIGGPPNTRPTSQQLAGPDPHPAKRKWEDSDA